jgi:hypothetical protein
MERDTSGGTMKNAGSGPKAYWAKMTPAQRTAEMKRRAAVTRAKKAVNQPTKETSDALQTEVVGYALGYCTAWLQTYAERTGSAQQALAERVGRLLSTASRR